MAKFAVIVVAAGKSERFEGKEKKIFAKISDRPLFIRTLEHFINREDVCQTILVVAPEDQNHMKEKYAANLAFMGVKLVEGGAERPDSVANGLEAAQEDADYVAVHDAARTCVTEAMIDAVFAEAVKSWAAILAATFRGTIKRGSDAGVIDQTVPRENLWEAQTPQVFKRSVIVEAYEKRGEFEGLPTDDAQLVEAAGHPVSLVESDFSNLKITTRSDITLAQAIIRSRPKVAPKGPRMPFEEAQW
ncbi:MAG: 2-C-methyl-D-erythritol 4-phosphate cytidylyltransferase [Planctomycetota bacterium]|nr:MAG: 2-C-methyl-D-erythritol 4-phosphate cytidylyltransferase [Planctomycetota bacterium]